ncbi:hypothetical protein [Nocardia australiensis]|uniref:hypothetical protein n=1 Tax=Nocardia australiensis TaxID=2887191 RepID=UPI001D139780|nr:hypothetical protein [Nocardia australiensis]
MITFIVCMAVLIGFAVIIASGQDQAGSTNIIDRDAQRLRNDLDSILAHSHHR